MLNPIAILKRAFDAIMDEPPTFETMEAECTLASAIQHIARPDRATYPKTRRGTKKRPVTRILQRKERS